MQKKLHMTHTILVTGLLSILSDDVSSRGLVLEPLSDFGGSYRVSGICFLPDCMDKLGDINYDINTSSKYCRDKGFSYVSSGACPAYYYREVCDRDSYYIKCDAKRWCKENGYLTESCVVPEYLDEKCLNGLEFYRGCKRDDAKACGEENGDFVSECQVGWELDDKRLCTYSPAFGICCNKCEGYEYGASDIPQGYVTGERCDGCDGVRYKALINPCLGYSECSEYGPVVGSGVCWSGDVRKYKNCEIGCPVGYIDWCSPTVTDCGVLGYGKAVSGCSGKDVIYCPYDRAKVMCW